MPASRCQGVSRVGPGIVECAAVVPLPSHTEIGDAERSIGSAGSVRGHRGQGAGGVAVLRQGSIVIKSPKAPFSLLRSARKGVAHQLGEGR